jgi:hypothetical protein
VSSYALLASEPLDDPDEDSFAGFDEPESDEPDPEEPDPDELEESEEDDDDEDVDSFDFSFEAPFDDERLSVL